MDYGMALSFATDPPHETRADGDLVLNPVGGGGKGGGSGYTLPITLEGANAVIGYVVCDSQAALRTFFSVVAQRDRSGNFIVPLTTADFKEPYSTNATRLGYFDTWSYVAGLNEAFQAALRELDVQGESERPRGRVVYCLSGLYAVRPIFVRRSGTGSEGSEYAGDSAVQFSLYALDFGTEAQLATWDGSKYLCDLDENGEPREEPVVKRLNFSACPSAAGL